MCARPCMFVRLCVMCVRACACMCVACVCVCVRACVRAFVHLSVRPCGKNHHNSNNTFLPVFADHPGKNSFCR